MEGKVFVFTYMRSIRKAVRPSAVFPALAHQGKYLRKAIPQVWLSNISSPVVLTKPVIRIVSSVSGGPGWKYQ